MQFNIDELQLLYHACEDAKMLSKQGFLECEPEDQDDFMQTFLKYDDLGNKLKAIIASKGEGV